PLVYSQGANVERKLSIVAVSVLAADQRESASISICESQTASPGCSVRVAGDAARILFDARRVLPRRCVLPIGFLHIEFSGVGALVTTRSIGARRRCGPHFRIAEQRRYGGFC